MTSKKIMIRIYFCLSVQLNSMKSRVKKKKNEYRNIIKKDRHKKKYGQIINTG